MRKVKYNPKNDKHIRWLLNKEDHRFTPESIAWVYESDGMAYTTGWNAEETVWRDMTEKDLLKFDRFMDVLKGNLYHRNVMSKIHCQFCAPHGWIIPSVPKPWWVRVIRWAAGTN